MDDQTDNTPETDELDSYVESMVNSSWVSDDDIERSNIRAEKWLTGATIAGTMAYGFAVHPDDFTFGVIECVAAYHIGFTNNLVRKVGKSVGKELGLLLGSRDTGVVHKSNFFGMDKTLLGYARVGGFIGAAAALTYAAPHTMDFAREKLIPKYTEFARETGIALSSDNHTGDDHASKRVMFHDNTSELGKPDHTTIHWNEALALR